MTKKDSFAGGSTTERILARLAKGDWVSGEELADEFGISRAAIAKHMGKLRRDGNVIRSRTHKGYMLEAPIERLCRDSVFPLLRTSTLGRTEWRELESAPSTNTEAISWALGGGPVGGVVTAYEQTQGKGRRGHTWFSSPRGIHFSAILPPFRKAAECARVNMAALQAVRQAIITAAGVEAVIKKPNDLLLNGKKICGILVESGLRGGETDWLVVGIGCNVNVLPEEFPADIGARVTSILAETGTVASTSLLAAEALNYLEEQLDLG